MNNKYSHLIAFVALVVGVLHGSFVFAQDTREEIARRELLSQAEAASDANDHAHALDLAVRAGGIRMSPSLRLLIGQEHNHLGHLLEALEFAGRCGRDAESDPSLNNRERILTACRELVTGLRSRVAFVTVQVPTTVPAGTRVRLMGGELSQVLWGISSPVLPGHVVVDAEGPGGMTFHQDIELSAGASATITVNLSPGAVVTPVQPPTHEQPPTPPGPVVVTPPLGIGPGPSPMTPPAPRPSILPWVVVGAGGLSLILGGVFVVGRGSAISERDAACDSTGCDPSAQGAHSSAVTFSTLANVTFVVGGLAVAGGLTWYFLGRPRAEARANIRVWPHLATASHGAVAGVAGSF